MAVATAPHPVDHDFDRANRELADAVDAASGRLVGLCRVDPWDGEDALALLERSVNEHGHRGLLLHPAEEHFRINDARLIPLAQLAENLGIPVLVAAGYPWLSEPSQVAQFAGWCPGVPVVMTNGGQFNISGLSQIDAEAALRLDNVHIQTSGVYREDFLQKVVRTFGVERVMFASAAPYFDLDYERMRVGLLHVAEEERAQIFAGNAQRVFRLDERVNA
ncbi:hypothetical protein GCM10028802_26380 [Terrabacter terrigena]